VPIDVLTEATIERPKAEVAAFAGDPANAPRWYVNIESADWQTPPPLSVGSRIAFVARFLGRTMRYTYEITELLVDERLVMRTAEGPFPMETTYEWHAASGGGTRMTLRNRGAPTGFGRLLTPVLSRAVRRATTKDLARLKRVLESDALSRPE
jgi:hypothetical protein